MDLAWEWVFSGLDSQESRRISENILGLARRLISRPSLLFVRVMFYVEHRPVTPSPAHLPLMAELLMAGLIALPLSALLVSLPLYMGYVSLGRRRERSRWCIGPLVSSRRLLDHAWHCLHLSWGSLGGSLHTQPGSGSDWRGPDVGGLHIQSNGRLLQAFKGSSCFSASCSEGIRLLRDSTLGLD